MTHNGTPENIRALPDCSFDGHCWIQCFNEVRGSYVQCLDCSEQRDFDMRVPREPDVSTERRVMGMETDTLQATVKALREANDSLVKERDYLRGLLDEIQHMTVYRRRSGGK